jgi:hypothetical protein
MARTYGPGPPSPPRFRGTEPRGGASDRPTEESLESTRQD